MMVKRHAPFKITPKARRVWLECYIEILKDLDMPEDLKLFRYLLYVDDKLT